MWKVVSKEEFDAFISSRPDLRTDLTHICDPPQLRYYDPKIPGWDSILAKISKGTMMNDYPNSGDRHSDVYYLLDNKS